MAAKMGNKLVALCTVAVGAVYAAGYMVTDTPQTAVAATTPSSGAAQPDSSQSDSSQPEFGRHHRHHFGFHDGEDGHDDGNFGTSPSQPSTSGRAATPSNPAQSSGSTSASSGSTSKYKDGTYTGTGYNNIGSVTVAVTIKSGKIADVQITQCTTHYPESDINPRLPQQVVSTQSPQVSNVSGATKSTRDFETAVLQALAQAQKGNA